MEDMIAELKYMSNSITDFLAGMVIGLLGGFGIKMTKLTYERNKWRKVSDSRNKLNIELKKKIVELIDKAEVQEKIVESLIRENRRAHRENQELRKQNNYFYAMMIRDGKMKKEDLIHLNKNTVEEIVNLVKNMNK